MKALEIEGFKGGAGSGNFGHAGRPGKVGGSSRRTGLIKEDDIRLAKSYNSKPDLVEVINREYYTSDGKPIGLSTFMLEKVQKKMQSLRRAVDNAGSVSELKAILEKELDGILKDKNSFPYNYDIYSTCTDFCLFHENDSIETSRVIDCHSNDIVFRKSGDKDSVEFTDDEISKYFALGEKVLVHNHPSHSEISAPDITFASSSGLDGIMASSHPLKRFGDDRSGFSFMFFGDATDKDVLARKTFSDHVGKVAEEIDRQMYYMFQPIAQSVPNIIPYIESAHGSIRNKYIAEAVGAQYSEVLI